MFEEKETKESNGKVRDSAIQWGNINFETRDAEI